MLQKQEFTCTAPCTGGAYMVSQDLARSFVHSEASADEIGVIVGLGNGQVQALHRKPSVSPDQLFATHIATLDDSCSSVSSDGISTVIATSGTGQF